MSRLHKPKAGFWIRLCAIVIVPLDRLLFRLRWQHLERVTPPAAGGTIIAVNHVSHIDTLVMAGCIWRSGRIPRFMVKASLFHTPLLSQLMRGAGQIPVYRGTADAANSLDAAAEALRKGEAVIVYPEGTTTKDPDNWPMQPKTGIARLVLLCPDIPVVPVGQWGAHKRHGLSFERLVRRRTAQVSVGQPMDLSRFRGSEPTAETLRELSDTIMSAVRGEVAALRGEPAPAQFFRPARKYVDKG